MLNTIISSNHYVSQCMLNPLLYAIKNVKKPNLLIAINALEKLESKNTYQHEVLNVLKWFNTYYGNCIGYQEQEFIGKHIFKIINSPYPRKALDTLCLLYYYNLHKSQDQLNNEFLSLKFFLEKNKKNTEKNHSILNKKLPMSIEAYMDIILKNKHCKKIANILAILNNHGLLTEKEVTYLLEQTQINFELLEKCLVELNNKFLIKNDFLLEQFIKDTYTSTNLDKLKQVFYTSQSKTIQKIFLLLDKFSILTLKNIDLVLNAGTKKKNRLLAKLLILIKTNNLLTQEAIDYVLTTWYVNRGWEYRKILAEILFRLNHKSSFFTEANLLIFLKLSTETISTLKRSLYRANLNFILKFFLIKNSQVLIFLNPLIQSKENSYHALKNLPLTHCPQLKTKLNISPNKKHYLKRPASSKPYQLSVDRERLRCHSKPKPYSWLKKIKHLLSYKVNELINKLKQYIERYKNKKTAKQQYKSVIKQLTEATDIKHFAKTLCDIGLLYEETRYYLKKKSGTHSIIENLITTLTRNSQQAEVLSWLNSHYYRYSTREEKKFIQQHLDKILEFIYPKKALHVLWMLYYCNFHTEKRINAILVSNQVNHFITLFLEKLSLYQGKSVDVFKKAIESDLDKLNALSTMLKSDKIEVKHAEAVKKSCQIYVRCKPNVELKQVKPVSFFPLQNLIQKNLANSYSRPCYPTI